LTIQNINNSLAYMKYKLCAKYSLFWSSNFAVASKFWLSQLMPKSGLEGAKARFLQSLKLPILAGW